MARVTSLVRRKHCGVVDPKHAWKLHAREPSDPVAIRGWKAADRWEKAMSYKAHRHGNGESHSGIVPRKRSNAGGSRVFPISRRAAQRGAPARVPARSAAHVVVADSAAVKEPAGPWNKSWERLGCLIPDVETLRPYPDVRFAWEHIQGKNRVR